MSVLIGAWKTSSGFVDPSDPQKKRSNDLLGLSSFMQYVLPLNVSLRRYPNHSHGFLGTIEKYY